LTKRRFFHDWPLAWKVYAVFQLVGPLKHIARLVSSSKSGGWSYTRDRSRTIRRLLTLHIGDGRSLHSERTTGSAAVP
jgi:hypothetical protein